MAKRLLGDFNSVMDNDQDIVTGEKHNGKEVEALNNLTAELDLMTAGKRNVVTNESMPGAQTRHSQLDDSNMDSP